VGQPRAPCQDRRQQEGQAAPPHVVEAMRKGRLGKPHDEETRAKLRRNHVTHGAWTAEEDELVRTLPPKDAAKATGRTLIAVDSRRRVLKVTDGRPGRAMPPRKKERGVGVA
jgi:hypothetical protein